MTTIAVLGSGGTISAVADAQRRNGGGLGAAAIADNAGPLPSGVDLRTVDVRRIPGRAITPSDMVDIARAVRDQLAAGADGVVVTHGTDTVEETAYALALMVVPVAPIVLTAAMRLPEDAGHDGAANFRAAVAAAADPRVGDLGPVLAIQDELHLARWVTKAHTARVAAFASPETGPAGAIVEGRVVLTGARPLDDHVGLPDGLADTRVELLWVAAGMDGLLVEAAARRADGLVVAGSGGGHVPPPVAAALHEVIARGIPVVIASRCAAGPTLTGTYDGEGGELHLRSIGARFAGTLPPLKARLRLQVALALGLDAGAVFPA
jgi:L-asparaginase